MNSSINVVFQNIKNFKNNFYYAKELIDKFDLCYFCETWMADVENNFLKIASNIHVVLKRNEFNIKPSVGRPYGGQAWYVNKNYKIVDYKFLNNHLSYIIISKNEILFRFVGVYLPFDNNTSDTLFEFDGQLILLTEIIKTYSSNCNVIIGGDFNADPFRGKRFDNRLEEFIHYNNLTFLDSLCTQNTGYSYYNNDYTAHIDHILTKFCGNKQLFYNLQCNILNSDYNLSDHLPITFEAEMSGDNKISKKIEKQDTND